MNRTPEDYEEEREELEETSRRSILSGWAYRVLFGLVALAVGVVIGLPYLLEWWSPPPPVAVPKAQVQPAPPPPSPAPKTEEAKPEAVPTVAKPAPAPIQPAPATAPPPKVAAKALAKPEPPAPKPVRKRAPAKASARGEYWVQVGAFTDQANASRLAARLTTQKYRVQQLTRPSGDQPTGSTHEVFVLGASAEEVSARLPGKEYQVQAAGSDVVIRPALGLKEAVTLSKELARQGLTVRIRRSAGTGTLHVVRVGAYPDRRRAQAVQEDLEAKGFAGFIVRGERR